KVKILPGIMPIIGDTQAEAEEIAAELASYIHPDHGRGMVERVLYADTSDLDFDEKVPAERLVEKPGYHERWRTLYKPMAERMTIREMTVELSRASGHQWVTGTAQSIADIMIDWFDSRA